jgi:hypothetical protein
MERKDFPPVRDQRQSILHDEAFALLVLLAPAAVKDGCTYRETLLRLCAACLDELLRLDAATKE